MPEISTQTWQAAAREIGLVIAQARTLLESCLKNGGDTSLLHDVAQALHQVRGALQMLEIHGGALLLEEMEQVARHLADVAGKPRHRADGLDSLIRAITQLPEYLERVYGGRRDIALVLLPLLNDLRAVRGSQLLSEGAVLLLHLQSDRPAQPLAISAGEAPLAVGQWARRLRPTFQTGLLGWIRGDREEYHLEALAGVALRMEQVATEQCVFQLWWVLGAIIEALREQGIEASVAVKRLLGLADRELKALHELGEGRYARNPPIELLNNLLYYVARSNSSGSRISAVRQSFRLDELLPVDEAIEQERAQLSAPASKLMHTVAAGIRADLTRIKETLDLFVRRGSRQVEALQPQTDMLQKIADTLGVLGLGDLRTAVLDANAQLRAVVSGQATADLAQLVQVAAMLIKVDDRLNEQILTLIESPAPPHEEADEPDQDFMPVQAALLNECSINLARIKEYVEQSANGHLNAAGLDGWRELIRGVQAGLLMLGRTEAVEVLSLLTAQLSRLIRSVDMPLPAACLDRLADAFVSLEFYIETLQAGRKDPTSMLDTARRCLESLADEALNQTMVAHPAPTLSAPRMGATEETVVGADLLRLFAEEAGEEQRRIQQHFPIWERDPGQTQALELVQRAFHTLKGSGRVVGARDLSEFSAATENLLSRLLEGTVPRSPATLQALREAVNRLPWLVGALESGVAAGAEVGLLVERIRALAAGQQDESSSTSLIVQSDTQREGLPDATLYEIYMREMSSHIATIRAWLQQRSPAAVHSVPQAVYLAAHTMCGCSRMAQAHEGERLAIPMERWLCLSFDSDVGLDDAGLALLGECMAVMESVLDGINESVVPPRVHEGLLERIALAEADLQRRIDECSATTDQPEAASEASENPVADIECDPEVAAIFCEEAAELLDAAQFALGEWNADVTSAGLIAALKRPLHTLKGGARMAGIAAMGDLAHELESLVVQVELGLATSGDEARVIVQQGLDELARMRDAVLAGLSVLPAPSLIAQIRQAAQPAEKSSSALFAPAEALPLPPAPLPPGREPQLAAERSDLARVRAELLDQLLNGVGETSIVRARTEQQLAAVEFNLGELSRTVTRLKEQLRKLELETEAQILNRHSTDADHYSNFDPLELDRYSSIQQFSRALTESASDLGSLQQLLETMVADAQTQLEHQGRLISELQNGLMSTRMVPFQRHVQRLSRIVRQAAQDVGRPTELIIEGGSGELDRQVLERMLPPLEHMLRNAVVHGIEAPDVRQARGKELLGHIRINLRREGAEVIIELTDDGGGMDLAAIRDKGIQSGLIHATQEMSADELIQLVLEPGFSTAGSVTQQAGRGVGMDVVATEIKKLGGALHIDSLSGQGTRFTIKLPVTLATSHALVVRVGKEIYALPLPTLEGVTRLSREDVITHLHSDSASLMHAGSPYRIQPLAHLIGMEASQLPEQETALPLVLVRAGENSAALVADELIGSREIVVKPVGPQLASIRGISGATILNDGRVAVILDLGALVRGGRRGRSQPLIASAPPDQRPLVMVVDDSITVRRVTQRLMERNGMRVLTARDGIDALALLQEHRPDILLMDIEMPRMDGYEVAAQVRTDPVHRDLPIIMITSRVGEKHRARAIELGVNEYLGKPYQESQLLAAIAPLVASRRSALAG